jgi:hypothetical protein
MCDQSVAKFKSVMESAEHKIGSNLENLVSKNIDKRMLNYENVVRQFSKFFD